MKKLLSILAGIGVTATASSAVVACASSNVTNPNLVFPKRGQEIYDNSKVSIDEVGMTSVASFTVKTKEDLLSLPTDQDIVIVSKDKSTKKFNQPEHCLSVAPGEDSDEFIISLNKPVTSNYEYSVYIHGFKNSGDVKVFSSYQKVEDKSGINTHETYLIEGNPVIENVNDDSLASFKITGIKIDGGLTQQNAGGINFADYLNIDTLFDGEGNVNNTIYHAAIVSAFIDDENGDLEVLGTSVLSNDPNHNDGYGYYGVVPIEGTGILNGECKSQYYGNESSTSDRLGMSKFGGIYSMIATSSSRMEIKSLDYSSLAYTSLSFYPDEGEGSSFSGTIHKANDGINYFIDISNNGYGNSTSFVNGTKYNVTKYQYPRNTTIS